MLDPKDSTEHMKVRTLLLKSELWGGWKVLYLTCGETVCVSGDTVCLTGDDVLAWKGLQDDPLLLIPLSTTFLSSLLSHLNRKKNKKNVS